VGYPAIDDAVRRGNPGSEPADECQVTRSAGEPLPVRSARRVPDRRGDYPWRRLRGWLGTARAAFVAHLLSLLAAFAVLLYYGSHQWFFTDEWEFITRNLPGPARLGLFVPHNEHWSTLPILIYRMLFAAVGLHTYLPYILVLIALHLIAAHLIWRLAIRAGASAWMATSIVAVFLLLGAGWEQLVSAFQMSFSLSLVCGLGWLLVSDLDLPAWARILSGWALGIAASMSSGIGIPMIGVVAVAALARRGPRDALTVASAPVLANLAWYAIVHPHATLPSTGRELSLLPQFVWHGLSATADSAVGLPVVGTVLLVALVVWLIFRNRAVPSIALGSAAGSLFLFILVGYGRLSLGVDQAAAPRYIYLAAALLACPAAVALTAVSRRTPLAEPLLVAALALSTLHGAYILRLSVRGQLVARLHDRDIVLAAAKVVTSGAALLGTQLDPIYGPDIDIPDLRTLVQTRALAVTDPIDPASLLTVESRVEISAGPAPAVSGPPPVMTVLEGTTTGSGACVIQPLTAGAIARVQLAFPKPSAFSVSEPRPGSVTVVLMSGPTGHAAAPPIIDQLGQGTVTWISVAAPDAVLIISVRAQTSFAGTAGC
jgi:hypothetical protein